MIVHTTAHRLESICGGDISIYEVSLIGGKRGFVKQGGTW